ncbi:hypothetical protein [Secundilactobacillus kimchicus]|uniref:hypothetical protein n=1 Tax=Secundilactobacillus kimchicus TaxID=528209 RepID=UPI0024A7F971|nr:hypothetical protein [Secundilactobacillus kimchicus]
MKPTEQVLKNLNNQLREDIGYSLQQLKPFDGQVPNIMRRSTVIYSAKLNKVPLLLVFLINEVETRTEIIKLWTERLTSITTENVVVVLTEPTQGLKPSLVKGRVPFVTLNHDYYLPFLSLRMFESETPVKMPRIMSSTHLTRKASQLLTVLIYASEFVRQSISKNPEEIFDPTGVSFTGGEALLTEYGKLANIHTTRTLNRALADLEATHVIQSIGPGTRKTYVLSNTGLDLLEDAADIMRSPIRFSVTADAQLIEGAIYHKAARHEDIVDIDGASLAGITAIAELTDLMPDDYQTTYVFSNELFDYVFDSNTKQTLKNVSIHRLNKQYLIRIENWAYDPTKISQWLHGLGVWDNPRIPDPVSLFLSNTEQDDGRVVGILEDLIDATLRGRRYG